MSHSAFDLTISRLAALTAKRALEFLPSEPSTKLLPSAQSWIRHLLGECHRDLSPNFSDAFNPMHVALDPFRVEQVYGAAQAVEQGDGKDWVDVVEGYVEQRGASGDIDRWAASHPRRQRYAEDAAASYDLDDEGEALDAGRYDELWEVGHRVVRYLHTKIESDVLPSDRALVFRLLKNRDPNDASAPLTALTYLDAVGESPGLQQLARVLAHPDPEVRKRAFRVVGRVREPGRRGPDKSRKVETPPPCHLSLSTSP